MTLLLSLLLLAQNPVQSTSLRGTCADAAGNTYKINVTVTSSVVTDDKGQTYIRYTVRNNGPDALVLNKKSDELRIVWSSPGVADSFKDYQTVGKKPVVVDVKFTKPVKLVRGMLYIRKGDETLCATTSPAYVEGD